MLMLLHVFHLHKVFDVVYLKFKCTVTSRLFTHIVSTEKARKDMRDRKDTRGTKYTYYNGCFLILLLVKSRLGTFPLFKVCLIYL